MVFNLFVCVLLHFQPAAEIFLKLFKCNLSSLVPSGSKAWGRISVFQCCCPFHNRRQTLLCVCSLTSLRGKRFIPFWEKPFFDAVSAHVVHTAFGDSLWVVTKYMKKLEGILWFFGCVHPRVSGAVCFLQHDEALGDALPIHSVAQVNTPSAVILPAVGEMPPARRVMGVL